MKKSLRNITLVAVLSLTATLASAQAVTAKVVTVEPSYMPDMVLFKLDAAFGSCAAGSWVYYYGTAYYPNPVTDMKKNVQAIYAGLLAAVISGKKMEVSGTATCVALNIHPTNQ